jgi:nucleotide-binding universal stress UspA family protein
LLLGAEFMKILVPVDGSPASIRAVRLAIDHVKAMPAEASLVLVNVQNFSGLSVPEGTEIMPSAWISAGRTEGGGRGSKRRCYHMP